MQGIIYDFDGTLADSLPAHIEFLQILKRRGFKCLRELPRPNDLRNSQAITSTPMGQFFKRAGFMEEDIPRLWEIYSREFSTIPECRYSLFEGVPEMIARLKQENLRLGIISSNIAENISPLISGLNGSFDFVVDYKELSRDYNKDKASAMRDVSKKHWGVEPSQVCYVGDTLSDYRSARRAGLDFIGVSYGFEDLMLEDTYVANSVKNLETFLVSLNAAERLLRR